MALGMGLIMLLVGVTMILRSQDDQVTASAQKATDRGLSAAETGITRYQSFINQDREIATYCANASTEKPSCNTGTTWSNVTSTTPETTPELRDRCDSNINTVVNKINAAANTDWKDVDSSDPSSGQYRLFSYTYEPNSGISNNKAPGTGTLTVEGRVNQSGSGNTASSSVGTATSRLQVNIPVKLGELDTNTIPAPGLMFRTGTLGNNNQVKGNLIFVGSCNTPTSGTVTESPFVSPSGSRIPVPSLIYPALPTLPWQKSSPTAYNNLGSSLSGGTTLPRNTDNYVEKEVDGKTVRVYEYRVDNINLSGNAYITPGKRVTFYLGDSISIGGNSSIQHSCIGYTPPNPNPLNEDCKPTDFQIFGYGRNFDSNSTIANPKLCLNGSGFLGGPLGTAPAGTGGAFILAPDYSVGAAGTGGSGGFSGSLWVKDYGAYCGSGANHIVLTQTIGWDELRNSGLMPKSEISQIETLSSWKREASQ